MKKILIILTLSLLLSSCYDIKAPQPQTVPNDPKLQELENYESLDISIENKNIPKDVLKEIQDRKNGYDNLNKSKAYYKQKELLLQKDIDQFREYMEITRKLMLADIKIVKAVRDWYLKESAINKNNYFYEYIRKNKNNPKLKKEILDDVDILLKVLDDRQKFNLLFFLNLDLNQAQNLNTGTSKVYFYTKLYLKKLSYHDKMIKLLEDMYKNMQILKIDRYKLFQDQWLWFLKKDISYIYKQPLKDLINDIKK